MIFTCMMYYSKQECYEDIYASLSMGILEEKDISHLLDYYKNLEHYECCQGIVEGYVDFKKTKNEFRNENTERQV